ncbi:Pannexin-1 [Liparis tanakae]|uniref:Pannexin-1 n=1 Tax=Liparis tanakae TaxID=230148 RepID=A0A4Z2GXE8_9TELE|nr:Pannexin-1 [Liparis tanakae]
MEAKYQGLRLELAVDKIFTFLTVGLPLFLISLAYAQDVKVGNQISCFAPANFSVRQAAYVDSFCWAALQQPSDTSSLWLHKNVKEFCRLEESPSHEGSLGNVQHVNISRFWLIPSLGCLQEGFHALYYKYQAPHLSPNLNFIMEELDRFYNRAIKFAKNLASLDSQGSPVDTQSALDLTEGCFKYPLVEQYLKTKRLSHGLVVKYLSCRVLTLLTLLLACCYLGYYILHASLTDEFPCDLRTGVLKDDATVPSAVQCKLVAVGVFRLLSYINLVVYALLAPVEVYAALGPARQSSGFLRPYELLPGFGSLGVVTPFYNDLSIYLLFLEENLSELKSYKCLQVLELLQKAGDEGFDTMCLLRTLGQLRLPRSFKRVQ